MTDGNITKYEVSPSRDGKLFRNVAAGNWKADAKTHTALFEKAAARYGWLKILDANGRAELEEIDVGACSAMPTKVSE